MGTLLAAGERFSSLSVERILAEGRVARSTFYVYFEDKYQVLQVLGHDAVDRLIRSARHWPELDTTARREDLRAVIDGLVQAYRGDSAVLVAVTEASSVDPKMRQELRRMLLTGHEIISAHVRDQRLRGGVRADIDAERTVAWIVTMLENGLYRHIVRASPDEVDAHVDAVTDLVWATLYAGAPSHSGPA